MGRKGVSREEKLSRLKSIIFEGKSVYSLKEMEKLGKKAGIVQQAIKECMDELESDNIIMKDKVGSGNFFYAFPSAAFVKNKKVVHVATEGLDTAKAKTAATHAEVAALSVDREPSDERTALLASVAAARTKNATIVGELAAIEENNPETIVALEKALVFAASSVERWTDNCECLVDFAVKATGHTRKDICKHAGVPEEGYPEFAVPK
jgi:hypothetical protein